MKSTAKERIQFRLFLRLRSISFATHFVSLSQCCSRLTKILECFWESNHFYQTRDSSQILIVFKHHSQVIALEKHFEGNIVKDQQDISTEITIFIPRNGLGNLWEWTYVFKSRRCEGGFDLKLFLHFSLISFENHPASLIGRNVSVFYSLSTRKRGILMICWFPTFTLDLTCQPQTTNWNVLVQIYCLKTSCVTCTTTICLMNVSAT